MHERRPTNEERAEALCLILICLILLAVLMVPPHVWGLR